MALAAAAGTARRPPPSLLASVTFAKEKQPALLASIDSAWHSRSGMVPAGTMQAEPLFQWALAARRRRLQQRRQQHIRDVEHHWRAASIVGALLCEVCLPAAVFALPPGVPCSHVKRLWHVCIYITAGEQVSETDLGR